MTLKRIEPGKRMSAAVIHGDKVYLAGFVAEAAAGKSVNEQTKDILSQIDATQAGTQWTIWILRCVTRANPTNTKTSIMWVRLMMAVSVLGIFLVVLFLLLATGALGHLEPNPK